MRKKEICLVRREAIKRRRWNRSRDLLATAKMGRVVSSSDSRTAGQVVKAIPAVVMLTEHRSGRRDGSLAAVQTVQKSDLELLPSKPDSSRSPQTCILLLRKAGE